MSDYIQQIDKIFVPYKLVVELNKNGFNEPCFGYWSDWKNKEPFVITCDYGTEKESHVIRQKPCICSAPTYDQIFIWFEEKHHLIINNTIYYSFNQQKWGIRYNSNRIVDSDILTTFFENKQEALNNAIYEALKMIKDV